MAAVPSWISKISHAKYICLAEALGIIDSQGETTHVIEYAQPEDAWNDIFTGLEQFMKSNTSAYKSLIVDLPCTELDENTVNTLNIIFFTISPNIEIYIMHNTCKPHLSKNDQTLTQELDKIDMKEFNSSDEFSKFMNELKFRGDVGYSQINFNDTVLAKGNLNDAWRELISSVDYFVTLQKKPLVVQVLIPQLKETISDDHKQLLAEIIRKLHTIPTRVALIYIDQKF